MIVALHRLPVIPLIWIFNMNKFEVWLLKGLLKKIVRQGDQINKICSLFAMLRLAADEEYYEDNLATRNAFLRELFDSTE